MSLYDEKIILFDGAMGTAVQSIDLPPSAWNGNEGCNEYLNLSSKETIIGIHESFLDRGAMVLETNTFGASSVVLAEYGLESRVEEINRAAVDNARAAIGRRGGRYIAGSVGPTTKLPTLGHISTSDLAFSYRTQFKTLIEAGVDCLIIETCQDLLQAKIAVITSMDTMDEMGTSLPVMLSVTIEQQGTMLLGSDISAVVATFEPFPLFSLGLNCATGPSNMESSIRYLSRTWPGRISCIPNAGLPEIQEGKTVYPLPPADFASSLKSFVKNEGVSIIGGCCGTVPEHIGELARAVEGTYPPSRENR